VERFPEEETLLTENEMPLDTHTQHDLITDNKILLIKTFISSLNTPYIFPVTIFEQEFCILYLV